MNDGESVQSDEPQEIVRRPTAPPLRIHHFLIITAVAAALLSLNRFIQRQDVTGMKQFFSSSFGISLTIATAISLTIVVFGFAWRREGFAFFSLPGHWLLLLHSLGIFFFLVFAAILAMRAATARESIWWPMAVYSWGYQLISLGLSAYAAWKIADSVPWRLVFIMDAANILLPLIAAFVSVAAYARIVGTLQLIPLVLISIAALGDRFAKRRRDWAHWLGVVMPFAVYGAYIFQRAVG